VARRVKSQKSVAEWPEWETAIMRRRVAPGRRIATLGEGALLVLILGSTLVIAKAALGHLGPLTLAALRYCLAALILIPLALRDNMRFWTWPPRLWLQLLAIGLAFYALGNGALFLSLKYLPAATTSLLLGLVPVVVLLGGIIWLREAPMRWQWVGMAIALIGTFVFFAHSLSAGEPLGLAIGVIGMLGSASLSLLGRPLARDRRLGVVALTAAPLLIGGLLLLPIALVTEGAPRLDLSGMAVVFWLAVVNTAFAYILYNHVLRKLAAFEVSALTSLSPLVTAIGAWLFLAEPLTALQIVGMIVMVSGVMLIQSAQGIVHLSDP
jgi:drug/metabolite transporter (DMT)-like permease